MVAMWKRVEWNLERTLHKEERVEEGKEGTREKGREGEVSSFASLPSRGLRRFAARLYTKERASDLLLSL